MPSLEVQQRQNDPFSFLIGKLKQQQEYQQYQQTAKLQHPEYVLNTQQVFNVQPDLGTSALQ